MCAEYLDLYWSRAAVCSGGVPVYACVVLVDTLCGFASQLRGSLLVYNNIVVASVVDATFKLTKINRLHLTITAHQP